MDVALRLIDAVASQPPALLYLAVFAWMVGQSLGAPLSSEALLLFAGYLASQGRVAIVLAWVAALAGSLAGASLAWYIADRWGPAGVDRIGKYVFLSRSKLATAHSFFRRRGVVTVFLARLVPLIQAYVSYPAGLGDMPFRPFIAATAAGAGIWCIAWLLIGQATGPRWVDLFKMLDRPGAILAGLVVLAVVAYFASQHFRKRHAATGEAVRSGSGRRP